MSALTNILPHYTYEDYRQWEGRWEIIDGIPYAMSPAPSMQHQWISSNIKGELRNAIKLTACTDCKVYDFIDIKIKDDTIVQPDASVVCGETPPLFLGFPPVIVVEILSPSTRTKDLMSKYDRYQKFGVKYYMIVDPEAKGLDIFCLTDDKIYAKQSADNTNSYTFQLNGHCGITLSLNKIWE